MAMAVEKQERDRFNRDREQLREAHWQIAEADAEDQVRTAAETYGDERAQHDWDNEGGTIARENVRL